MRVQIPRRLRLTLCIGAEAMQRPPEDLFRHQLDRVYFWYTGGFFLFVLVLALLEQLGLPRQWIGMTFLLATIGLYAAIGIMSRTTDPVEYYVAGRRVPAVYNGMATGADWMSAASFIGLAGTLYVQGFSGLAFVMGWTGGYCLVALFLAPYLRRFGQFTIPDFLGERYGGHWPRLLGIAAAILCSFVYVVAQIYGVGLITSRLTGVAFEVGVFLGLGGILVCSFLGGMRAVTWTQVAQYIVLIFAYMLPVIWLSIKQADSPVPQLIYGQQLEKITEREKELTQDNAEVQVQMIYRHQAGVLRDKLEDPANALVYDRYLAENYLEALREFNGLASEIAEAEKDLSRLPRDEASARALWQRQLVELEKKSQPLNGMLPHAQPFAGDPDGTAQEQMDFKFSRRNFLALVFCLMVGTAALPHILMRYYTVPDVRQARQSVTWSLVFISLLYFTAPALAVLVKFEVFNVLVGTPFDQLPAWVSAWSKVDADLLSVKDVNRDGILQLNEMTIGVDIIVLATAEIAGLPYVIAGLVAAGGLAAALSTADGLLLTIANALSHDLYYKMIDPNASTARRVTISKVLLLVVALAAAYVAAQKPADILFLVSSAFSIAASAFFPALVLGIFWKRATGPAAILGMLSGVGVTFYYMSTTQTWLRGLFGLSGPVELWWGIQPISAGVFGVPVGFAVMVLVSLVTRRPSRSVQAMVERIRYTAG
jgi:cation/acetate symporter